VSSPFEPLQPPSSSSADNPPGNGQPAGAVEEPSRSPIRPTHPPAGGASRPRLVPAKPPTDAAEPEADRPADRSPSQIAGLNPQETIAHLRERMAQAAEEFAAGKINRAQFHAIYNRYGEQRRIIEGLLARDPQSNAWKAVARPGHTSFLRQHFEARLQFYALFILGRLTPIVQHGTRPPRPTDVVPILRALPGFLRKKGPLGPAKKRVTGGNWLVIVPGTHTVSIVLYSLEPSAQQLSQIEDLHSDFERANVHALAREEYTPERLVFPQRALFEA